MSILSLLLDSREGWLVLLNCALHMPALSWLGSRVSQSRNVAKQVDTAMKANIEYG